MRKSTHITARVDAETLRALDSFPGQSRSERLAYCVRHASLVAHFDAQILRVTETLSARMNALAERAGAGVRGEIQQLLKSGGDSKVSAALAAVIEHSLLPAAAMDRKQPLKNALEQLRGGGK
jgi:hypothetical protein